MPWNFLLQPAKTFYRFLRHWVSRQIGNERQTMTMETRKFHREQILSLDRLVNIKVADLLYRMEDKMTSVPLNVRKLTAQVDVPIMIYGKDLVSWFITNMDITPNEALYLAYLLSSHQALYSITNHYLILLNFGFFHRYPVARSRNDSIPIMKINAIMDNEFVSYLSFKSMRLNMHGELDDYEIDDSVKCYVNLAKWKFEFIQSKPLTNT